MPRGRSLLTNPATLRMLPDFSDWNVTATMLVIPLAVQWWAVWYPGAEPGGGSYIAQRMLAAKDERHAMAGTLWFNVAHYALRPWPWVIVALASMLVFPTLADIQRALPHVNPSLIGHDLAYPAMLALLPHGMLGLLVASLLAAYVSMVTSFVIAVEFLVARRSGAEVPESVQLLVAVGAITMTWLCVTLLTTPTDRATLTMFYRVVRPAGPGWRMIREAEGLAASADSLAQQLLGWALGVAFVYSALFGAGNFLFGNTPAGVVCAVVFTGSGVGLYCVLSAVFRGAAEVLVERDPRLRAK